MINKQESIEGLVNALLRYEGDAITEYIDSLLKKETESWRSIMDNLTGFVTRAAISYMVEHMIPMLTRERQLQESVKRRDHLINQKQIEIDNLLGVIRTLVYQNPDETSWEWVRAKNTLEGYDDA